MKEVDSSVLIDLCGEPKS